MKAHNTKKKPTFLIRGPLAKVLAGMVGTNWMTSISKNNVKTVRVYFHTEQPTVPVIVD